MAVHAHRSSSANGVVRSSLCCAALRPKPCDAGPGNGCRTSMMHSGSIDTGVHWPIMATPAAPRTSSRRSTLPWHTGASPPGRLGESWRQHLRKRIVGLEPEPLPGRLGPKYEVCACERRLHTGVRQRTNLELGRDGSRPFANRAAVGCSRLRWCGCLRALSIASQTTGWQYLGEYLLRCRNSG